MKRGEHESHGQFVEDAQCIERDKPEEPHAVFHPAVDHGTTDVRVARDFVSDNDQTQVAVTLVAFESVARDGERFNQARDVFLRPDGAGV